MQHCKKCGNQMDGKSKYCTKCGAVLGNVIEKAQATKEQPIPNNLPPSQPKYEESKNNKGWLIVLLWVLFLPIMAIITISKSKKISKILKVVFISIISLFCIIYIVADSNSAQQRAETTFNEIKIVVDDKEYVKAQEQLNQFLKDYPNYKRADESKALLELVNPEVAKIKAADKAAAVKADPSSSAPSPAIAFDGVVSTTTVLVGKNLKISYIDVGQADSILIQTPGGKNVLIDAGNNGDALTIVTYLKAQNISRLDYVIATHSHEDHIGSMDTVINMFDIGQVVMPKESSNTQTFRDVMTAIASKGLKPIEAKAGVKLDLGPEIYAELLAPNSSGYQDINDYSAVLRLIYGNNSFLFMGDAETQSESEMLQLGSRLKIDVLKVGHHGSSTSSTAAFLKLVTPKYAVISVGKDNSYGHPTQEALGRLGSVGATIYRTDETGTIVCESDGETISFKTLGSSIQPSAPSSVPAAVVEKPIPVTPSQSNDQGVTVYGTETGAKYHAAGCRYLAKSTIPMTLSDAKSRGLTPCSVCKPPQ